MTGLPNTVRLLAGMPGVDGRASDPADRQYPSTATDVAKLLRERGLEVEFEHDRNERQYVSLHSADVWIPVLAVSLQVLQAVGEGLLTDVVQDLLGRQRAKTSTLHVTYKITNSTGEQEFTAIGPGADVLAAVEAFEGRHIAAGKKRKR